MSQMADSSNDDWRSACKNILEIQNKARHEAILTDIQFVLREGSEKKVFNAHKLILACGSPVFETMFYGALAEEKTVIETDDDPEAFEMLLDCIYGKRITMTSLISAWKYLIISDKYLVPNIQDIVKHYIQSTPLTEDPFWDIIQNNIFSSSNFFDKVNSYMMENTSKIITSEKFLSVPEDIIHNVLQMDKLNVREYDLLLAITKWGYKNMDRIYAKDLKKLYEHIRFSTITIDEFYQFIDSYPGAIDAQSSLLILQYLRNRSGHNLPPWCSISNVSRCNILQKESETLNLDSVDLGLLGDWRSDCKSIVEIQNKARHEAILTDIQFFIIEGSDKKVFNAHKLILACVSPVFEKIFYGALAEERSVIEIDDDPEAFEMLLEYIYGKHPMMTSLISAWKYVTICQKYLVREIQNSVKTYIQSISLTEDTFWDTIQYNIYRNPNFFDKVNSYMMGQTRSIILSEKFLSVPEDIVVIFLQMDWINLWEYDFLLAVTKWAYENIDKINPKDLRKFYKHIRFSTMQSGDFYKFIDSYPEAIDVQSSLLILQHLQNKNTHDLPAWCSTSQVNRYSLLRMA